jgi:hypothetical protein
LQVRFLPRLPISSTALFYSLEANLTSSHCKLTASWDQLEFKLAQQSSCGKNTCQRNRGYNILIDYGRDQAVRERLECARANGATFLIAPPALVELVRGMIKAGLAHFQNDQQVFIWIREHNLEILPLPYPFMAKILRSTSHRRGCVEPPRGSYCRIELAKPENTLFALAPINRIVPTTITRMTASITAYSAMSCALRDGSVCYVNILREMHLPNNGKCIRKHFLIDSHSWVY